MVRTVTEASLGKKIFSVFVALALVVGMMNLPSYRAFAEETASATETVSTTVAAQPEVVSETIALDGEEAAEVVADAVEVPEVEEVVEAEAAVAEPVAEASAADEKAAENSVKTFSMTIQEESANSVEGEMTREAFLAAAVEGVVTLTGDTTVDKAIEIRNNVSINLNGHKLFVKSTSAAIVYEGAKLSITDNDSNAGVLEPENRYGIYVYAGGSVSVSGGKILGKLQIQKGTDGKNYGYGAAVYVDSKDSSGNAAATEQTSVSISGNAYLTSTWQGIYSGYQNSTINISDNAKVETTGANGQHVVESHRGTINIGSTTGTATVESQNRVVGLFPYGGSLNVKAGAKVNVPKGFGIGLYAENNTSSALNMTGGEIIAGECGITGNNLYSGADAVVSGGTIKSAKTGIYWQFPNSLTLSDTTAPLSVEGAWTALEGRLGYIVINGGTFKATGDHVAFNPVSGTSTNSGAAINLVPNFYKSQSGTTSFKVAINGGVFESLKGDAITIKDMKDATALATVAEAETISINGGTFKAGEGRKPFVYAESGAASDKAAAVTVAGGNFQGASISDFAAPVVMVRQPAVKDGVLTYDPVAQVNGEASYTTLQAAINAAAEGDTIVMMQDLRESVTIDTGKKVTLDLNGKILGNNTSGFNENYTNGAIRLTGGELTLCDSAAEKGKLIAPDLQSNEAGSYNGSGWFFGTGIFVTDGAKLVVDGAIVESDGEAIAGNGSDKSGTSIELKNGAKAISTAYVGIFHPQPGTLTITDSEVSGATGIGIKSGTLTIAGSSKIAGNGKVAPNTPTGNGLNANGAAIQVEASTGYEGEIEISVSDNAEIKSVNGLAICQYDATGKNAPTENSFKSLTITGGTFTSGGGYAPVLTADATNAAKKVSISGGAFSSEIMNGYIAEGAGFHNGAVHVHESVDVEAVDATCTSTGLTAGTKCSICDAVLTAQEEVSKLDHTVAYTDAKAPTCTEDGLTQGTYCSVCKEVLSAAKTTDKLGHVMKEVADSAKAPTCLETGKYADMKCSREGCTYTETGASIPATGHTEAAVPAVEATCTSTGLTAGNKCSVCDIVLTKQNVVSMKPHAVVVDAAVAATCTTEGKTEGTHCSVCNEVLKAQKPTEAHAPEFHEAVAATCTTYGTIEYWACSIAQKTFADEAATKELTGEELVVKATGHNYEWVTITEATTEAAGSKHEVCSICGDAKDAVEIAKLEAPATVAPETATPVAPIAPAVAPQAATADAANDGADAATAAAPAADNATAQATNEEPATNQAEATPEQKDINEDETPLANAQVQGKNAIEDGFPVLPVAAGVVVLLIAGGAIALRRKGLI